MSTPYSNLAVRRTRRILGFVGGLSTTAMSMSSGFIWASQGRVTLVYLAGFLCWTGYLIAHKAVTGVFVDDVDGPESNMEEIAIDETTKGQNVAKNSSNSSWSIYTVLMDLRSVAPADTKRALGFVAGIIILVVGIAILAWYVRQENHLLGNLGSGLFLAGYVIAHYFDSGKLL